MKIVTASNGKTKVKISKKEWESVGKKAGWMKTAACMDHVCVKCNHMWFDNKSHGVCPKCGSTETVDTFDEPKEPKDYLSY